MHDWFKVTWSCGTEATEKETLEPSYKNNIKFRSEKGASCLRV